MRQVALLLVTFSLMAVPTFSADFRETGGDGFRILKIWEGSGTHLRIEYYGWLAERCNAGRGSGHQNQLAFFVRLNGRPVVLPETSCGEYRQNGHTKRYAIADASSRYDSKISPNAIVNPPLFQGFDPEAPWNLEIYVQAITGEYDSRYGQNYFFQL